VNWARIPIGSACESTDFDDPSTRSSFRYVDISSIDRIRKMVVEAAEVEGSAAPSRARKAIRAGDVLVSTVRPNLNAVAIVPEDLDGEIASTGFSVLRPRKEQLSERYLYYYCCTPGFVDALTAKVRGAQYPAVSDGDVKEVAIPLPPPSEQRRIVEILDQADRLSWLRAEVDAKVDRILPALFIKMFGDPVSSVYPAVELRTLARLLSGGAFPIKEQGGSKGEVPFIKVSDMNTRGNEWFIRHATHWVSREALKRIKVKTAPSATTVFPKIGAAVATNKKRLLTRETAYDNNVIGVIPKDHLFGQYVFAFFQLFDLRTLARSTAVPSIKTSELARIPIPKPPKGEVRAFNRCFDSLASSKDLCKDRSRQLDRLFALLLLRAFRGDLTASWRAAHMNELLQEMEHQAKALAATARAE
jgi:type I restriction enzyme S subunit